MSIVLSLKATKMGARQDVIPLDPTVQIKKLWGKGTHGECVVRGQGRFIYLEISNRGNHYCRVYKLLPDGHLELIEENHGGKYCKICEKYENYIWEEEQ
jgi:hypothetical protein